MYYVQLNWANCGMNALTSNEAKKLRSTAVQCPHLVRVPVPSAAWRHSGLSAAQP
jgi:hypothetical protein